MTKNLTLSEMKQRMELNMTPGEIRIIKDSDYPEPINVTELVKRVEVLEATVKLQEGTITNVLESLGAVLGLLQKLNRGN